jgi:predicted transcriptional regulator
MMGKIREDNYIMIQGWMVTELELKGNELLIFAIIHGFSQDGETRFTGGLQYLAEWTNSTKQGVSKNLKSLVNKGYIAKEEKIINGVKFCEYYATKFNGVLNKVEWGMQQSLTPIKQSLTGGIKQSLTNNKDNIINKNINNISNKDNKDYYPLDQKLNDTFKDFIEYRKKMRKPMTPRAIKLLMAKLDELSSDNDVKIQILNQSIMNAWTGVYPLKDTNKSSNKVADKLNDTYNMINEWMSEREVQ